MSLVLYEEIGPIAKITFNNESQLNAMTPEMGDELSARIRQLQTRSDLRCVLFTGKGKAFSSGGNLDFIISHTQKDIPTNKKEMIEFYSKFLILKNLPMPTIAIINGAAIGAGLCIAMACDLRVASHGAKLGVNFAKIGLSSGMGCLYHLVQLVGIGHAAELLFTGKIITAEEAHAIGLVNHVCSLDGLEAQSMNLAQSIAENSPVAIKIIKQGLLRAPHSTLEELFDYESEGQAQSFASQDLLEGISALKEKRPPNFKGK